MVILLSSLTGAIVYSLGMFIPKPALAQPAGFTAIKVKPTVVDVQKLPSLSPTQVARLRATATVPSTRIPIGEAQLNAIKQNPRSTPEGQAAVQASSSITASPIPPQVGARGTQPQTATSTYNCIGNSATGFAPSDSHGAVGLSNYVEVTNVDLGIYAKTSCTRNRFVSLKSFFGITDPNTTAFDPRAIYDFQNNRYVVTTETRNSGSTDQFQYFAVSKTSNPLGAWTRYKIPLSEGTSTFCKKAASDFWDYPNLGYNKDKWFITANNFPEFSATYGAIMTIDKAPTLTGGTPTFRCYGTVAGQSVRFNVAPPLDRSTTARLAYFISTGSGAGSQLLKYRLDTINNSMTFNTPIAIPAWTAPPNAPQPGTTLRIDTIDGRFQSNNVQIGAFVYGIHAINNGGFAAARLYKINAAANTAAVIFTLTAPNVAVWGPSFALRDTAAATSGFLAFNYSSSTINPSAALVLRRNDGVGGFIGYTYAVGVPMTNSCQNGTRCRWGDYSATSLDPSNLNSAFGVAQYMTGNSQFEWATKIMGLTP